MNFLHQLMLTSWEKASLFLGRLRIHQTETLTRHNHSRAGWRSLACGIEFYLKAKFPKWRVRYYYHFITDYSTPFLVKSLPHCWNSNIPTVCNSRVTGNLFSFDSSASLVSWKLNNISLANVTDVKAFCSSSPTLNRYVRSIVNRMKTWFDVPHCITLSHRLLVVDHVHYEYMKNFCDVVGGLMPVPKSGPELAVIHDDFADVLKQLHSGACRKDE